MNSHHIICEDDLKRSCPYCGSSTTLRKWRSVFSTCNSHYKECDCKCGHKVSVKMPFMGSGHDSWNKDLKNLDKRIEEEE
ncbi:hypothetical protein ACFL3V_03240 [Nanoarchaeota archaeon]